MTLLARTSRPRASAWVALWVAMLIPSVRAGGADPGDTCSTAFPTADYIKVQPGEVSPPKKISGPDPDFAEVEHPARTGPIILEVFISDEGLVDGVLIVRGKDDTLARPVAKAVLDWRFEPATVDGKPVNSRNLITLMF